MTTKVRAIYENGVFRPEREVDLPAGSRVEVLVPEKEDELLAEWRERYGDPLGPMSDEDAEEMLRAIRGTTGGFDADR